MGSSIIFEKIMIMPKYTIANFHRTDHKTISIARWNIPGTFVSLKGIN